MKRLAAWIYVMFFVFLCAVPGIAQDSDRELTEMLARELLKQWQEALNTEDIEAFAECYWDDAVRIIYFPGSEPEMNVGKAAVRAAEGANFQQFDFISANLVFEEPITLFPDDASPTVILPSFDMGLMNVFELEVRYGNLRIIRQYVFAMPVGP